MREEGRGKREEDRKASERETISATPSPSIPKTQKYVSPAAASWPGGST